MSVPQQLRDFFEQYPTIALGFSGGVDSSYLLYAATACGVDIQPYFIQSQFQPEFELNDAKKLAHQLGVELKIIRLDLSQYSEVLNNPADRCYHCKRLVFGRIIEQGLEDGYQIFIDGNNASDDVTDRPGMKAVEELEVRSPLREAGLTKDEVRELSRQAGLFTWNKPSYACLATRIPTGTEIKLNTLTQIEQAEEKLFRLGFSNYRIRVMGTTAKIQLPSDQMIKAIELRQTLVEELANYFDDIVLDLKGR